MEGIIVNPQAAGGVLLQYGAIGAILMLLIAAIGLSLRWFFHVAADRFLKFMDKIETVTEKLVTRIDEMGQANREILQEVRESREEAEKGRLAAIRQLREDIERNGNGNAPRKRKRRGS